MVWEYYGRIFGVLSDNAWGFWDALTEDQLLPAREQELHEFKKDCRSWLMVFANACGPSRLAPYDLVIGMHAPVILAMLVSLNTNIA